MVISSKRLNQQSRRFSRRASVFALLIRLIAVCFALLHKKRGRHLEKWEQEKILKLGLVRPNSRRKKVIPAKPIQTNAWEKEKIASFGLSYPCAHKNLPRTDDYLKKIREERNIAREILYRASQAKNFSIVQNASSPRTT